MCVLIHYPLIDMDGFISTVDSLTRGIHHLAIDRWNGLRFLCKHVLNI